MLFNSAHTYGLAEGEINLLNGKPSAIGRLNEMRLKNEILPYVKCTIERNHKSRTLKNQTGIINYIHYDGEGPSDVESADIDDELSNFISDGADDNIHDTISHNTTNNMMNISDNMEIISNISEGNKQYHNNFIKNSPNQYMEQLAAENQIYDTGNYGANIDQVNNYTPVNEYDRRMKELETIQSYLRKSN